MWRAVVIPQTIAAGKRVLNITVDGKNYGLVKNEAMQFVSGKMHKITVTVNKNTSTGDYTFELSADDIVTWVDDADLHDELVRQYLIVDVPVAGTLSQVLATQGIETGKLTFIDMSHGNGNRQDRIVFEMDGHKT